MSEKIVGRPFSKKGLDNWDKIFGKKKQRQSKVKPLVPDDSHIIPMIDGPMEYPSIDVCEECYGLDGKHKLGCLDYNGPSDPSH